MAVSTANSTLTPFAKRIPAGPKSKAFNDLDAAKKRQITGIKSVKLWIDRVVAGMQVTYTLANGKTYRAPVRGAKKGKVQWVKLEADEELIQISGQGNTGSIRALTFLSTRVDGRVRLHGPFGPGEVKTKKKGKLVKYKTHELLVGGSDDKGFSWYGGKVMAFTGATRGGRLNGLGVLTAPIVDVAAGITTTNAIAEDYHEVRSGSRGQKKLKRYSSYRSSVQLPGGTTEVTLWAEAQVKVKVNGRNKVLDPKKPVKVKPNSLSQLVINVEAKGLSVPAIKLRTNLMTDVWQWYTVHPDVAAHEKIAKWDADTLHNNRRKLGISKKASKEDCEAVQSAITNVAKLGLPGAGQASHERSVDAKAMKDANWSLDFTGGKARYNPAKKSQTKKIKKKAKKTRRTAAARGFFKDIGKGIEKAGKDIGKAGKDIGKGIEHVVVETSKTKPAKDLAKAGKSVGKGVEKVGKDIAKSKVGKSAAQLGKNVAKTGEQLGKDVAKGDFESFGKHLGEGGLQLGKDVARLGEHTVVTVVNAAGQAVEYVLDQAAAIGELIVDLLETIGAAIMKVIDFLIDLVPWKQIKATQKQLQSLLEGSLRRVASGDLTDKIEGQIDGGLEWLGDEGEAALDKLTRKLGGKVKPNDKVAEIATKAGKVMGQASDALDSVTSKIMEWLNKGLELVTWLVSKIFEKIPLVKDIAKLARKAAKTINAIVSEVIDAAREAGEELPDGLATAITNLLAIAEDPSKAPALLAAAMLQVVKAILGAGIAMVRRMIRAIFGATKKLAELALDLGRLDLFPGKKAKGNSIFVKIYNAVVGIDLSFFSVLTWLLAIPITLVHMAAFDKAPKFVGAKRADAAEIYDTSRTVGATICGFVDLLLSGILDTAEILRGAQGYMQLGPKGKHSPPPVPKSATIAEWASWTAGFLGHLISEPFIVKSDAQGAALYTGWSIGVVSYLLDLVSLWNGGARMRRWDFSGKYQGREGGVIALLLGIGTLVSTSIVLVDTKASVARVIADLSAEVGGLVAALFMIFVPKPSPHGAIAIGVLDTAFGVASLGAGFADDYLG